MPEIRHQQPSSAPEIDFAEIHIPDDEDMGTGTFTTVFAPDALLNDKNVTSDMFNAPEFQISVNINLNREVPVLLGKADGSPPRASSTFLIPLNVDPSKRHTVVATFSQWQVIRLTIDGLPLTEKP